MLSSTLTLGLALLAIFTTVRATPFAIRQQITPAPEPDCAINSICFALDQSGSINDDEYVIEQQFVIAVSRQVATRTTGTQYSAYGFSSSANLIQASTTQLDAEFIVAVNETSRFRGGTNIYDGLMACAQEVGSSPGNRVIVLITDGGDTGSPPAIDLAPTVKADGIAIVTIGVGNSVDADYLRALATTPSFFVDSSFETLPSDVVRVAESSCDVVQVTPGPDLITPTPEPFDACQRAYETCELAFAGADDVPALSVDGAPDVPISPAVVSRDASERLGVLNTNDISVEVVQEDGAVLPITALPAAQPFSRTQFKPLSVPALSASAIAHETFQADQREVARDRCVRVFFSQLQLTELAPPYNVVANVVADRSDNKCVVFRTV